jgi:predicted nucleic acid-binding Zn ribbon protein
MEEAMKKFLEGSRVKGGIQALQIEAVWEKIMGKTIARYTQKLQIIGDKLIITTEVGPLKKELIYQKEKIQQRVNESMGSRIINEVIIQ